jgi:zinc transporter ZupT
MFQLANLIMGKFLGAIVIGGETYTDIEDFYTQNPEFKWVGDLVDAIQKILVPILSIVAAAGIIWAVVLGVQMARADSTEKRDEAKKRLIGLVVGLVIMIVLIVFFLTFFDDVVFAFLPAPATT